MSVFFAETFREHTDEEIKAIMARIMFLMNASKLLKCDKRNKRQIEP